MNRISFSPPGQRVFNKDEDRKKRDKEKKRTTRLYINGLSAKIPSTATPEEEQLEFNSDYGLLLRLLPAPYGIVLVPFRQAPPLQVSVLPRNYRHYGKNDWIRFRVKPHRGAVGTLGLTRSETRAQIWTV